MKFETNLIFLIKPFCYMTKTSRQKLKYRENKKSFWKGNKKHFSSFLKSVQLPKNCLKPESAPLIFIRSRYKKIAIASICLNFQTLEIQVAQEQREATKDCDQKILLIKEQRKQSRQLNEALFRQFLHQSQQSWRA